MKKFISNNKMKNYTAILFLMLIGLFTGCIEDDDGTPDDLNLPKLSISDVKIEEPNVDNTIASFEVTLEGENQTNVIASFAATSESAEANVDFQIISEGKLIFAAGENKKTIEVEIKGDVTNEPDETFNVIIFNAINATIEKEIGVGTIVDNDGGSQGNPLDIPTTGFSTPESYPGFDLIWSDEFDATTLNLDDWNFEIGNGSNGWGNSELQYYQESNTSLVDGHLVIEARQGNVNGFNYTSSRITTQDKFDFKYGRVDIRAALPEGQGIWPALWMLGANFDQVGWPTCGEIDIMELVGHLPGRTNATVHYPTDAGPDFTGSSKSLASGAKFSEEFHVFSINWREDNIEFLLDDVIFHSITPAVIDNASAYPFNDPFFFIFNVAVGGDWPGSPDDTTIFPQRMIVDYIRVFQL